MQAGKRYFKAERTFLQRMREIYIKQKHERPQILQSELRFVLDEMNKKKETQPNSIVTDDISV